jgi:hypothetical protein
LFDKVRFMYEGDENGNGTEVSLNPREWLGLLGERDEWYARLRGGIGPIPAYNLRSRSRAAEIWRESSDDIFELFNVGETTSD